MKKKNNPTKLLAAIIIILVTLISCEKIIDVSIPDRERKIVVNGLIGADKPVMVNLSKSLSILENDSLILISGADIKLFNGDNLIGKMRMDSAGFYSLPDFSPVIGEMYKLTAAFENLNPVEALAELPELVPVVSVDTATWIGEWGQEELRLTVKFKDPAGVKNIYAIGADATYNEFDYRTNSYTGKKLKHPVYLYSGDNDRFLKDESTNYDGKLYFQDLLFDGMTKVVEFGISDYAFYESDTVWLDIKLEQIDPSYFKYILSSEAYQRARDNPFAEPVQVYTNVTNGFGIFAGTSTSIFTIEVTGKRKF